MVEFEVLILLLRVYCIVVKPMGEYGLGWEMIDNS